MKKFWPAIRRLDRRIQRGYRGHTLHPTSSKNLYDHWLLLAAILLVSIGVLMVASTSIVVSEQQFQNSFYYLYRQIAYLGLGVITSLVILRLEITFWQRISRLLLLLSIVLLIATLIPGIGRSVNGSMRWIAIGSLTLQASEFAKLAMIIYLAGYLVRHSAVVTHQLSGFIKPVIVLAVISMLLLLEPDFGAIVVIGATAFGVLFLAGVRISYFVALLLAMVCLATLLIIVSPYRLARLTAFLHPWASQFDSGYQLTQSLIAFGRGGWLGVGLGESLQKLFYLPEAHTDFLIAVLAEELGLLGVLFVVALFTLLVSRAFLIGYRALRCDMPFAAYLTYGLALYLGLQAMINMGVNVGVLPTKGLTLPLMSYGGSSLLVSCVSVALLLRVDHEVRWRSLKGTIK